MSFKRFKKLQKYQGDNKVIPYVYKKGDPINSITYETWFDCYKPYGKWSTSNEKLCKRVPFEDGMILGYLHEKVDYPFEIKYNQHANIEHPDYEVPDCETPYPDLVDYSIAKMTTTGGRLHSVIIDDKIENLKHCLSNIHGSPVPPADTGASCIAYGKWYFNLDVSECKSLNYFYLPEWEERHYDCPTIKAIYFMKPFSDNLVCLNSVITIGKSLEEIQFLGLTGHNVQDARHFIDYDYAMNIEDNNSLTELHLPLLRGKEDGSTWWRNFLSIPSLEYLDISSLRLPVDIDPDDPSTFTAYFIPYGNFGFGQNMYMLGLPNIKIIKCTRRTKEIFQAVDAWSLENDLSEFNKHSWLTGSYTPLNVKWIISDDEEIKDVESVPEPMIFDLYTVKKFYIDTDNDGIYETETEYRKYEYDRQMLCDEGDCQYCTDYDLFEWREVEDDYICEEVMDEKCKGCYPFKIRITNGTQYFRNDLTLTFFDNEQYDLTECETLNQLFSGCINLKGHIDLSEIKSISWYNTGYRTFYNCENITSIDLSNWFLVGAIRDVQFNFNEMFKGCTNLEYIDASNFRIEVATKTPSTSDMFWGCKSLKKIRCTQEFRNLVGNKSIGAGGGETLNDVVEFEIV